MKKSFSDYIQEIKENLVPDKIKFDCRYYTGYKPCGKQDLCVECGYYSPQGKRIVIIKLGALGDVLRTTPLLRSLKKHFAPCHITWVTNPSAIPLFEKNTFVDRVFTFDPRHLLILTTEIFDTLYCFEKDAEALALAEKIQAKRKIGFSITPYGTPSIYNAESIYALQLSLNNPMKFKYNKKSYQEVTFEMAGLEYQGEEYILEPTQEAIKFADELAKRQEISSQAIKIGINTGCGGVFKTKQWTVSGFCELISKLGENSDIQCLLLGGEREREFNSEILKYWKINKIVKNRNHSYPFIVDTGCDNSLENFIGIVNLCDVVVTSDSLAMHIAIGLQKEVLAFFGPTCAQEIDLSGRGTKITTDFDCSPCYLNTCDKKPTCMQAMRSDDLLAAVLSLIQKIPNRDK